MDNIESTENPSELLETGSVSRSSDSVSEGSASNTVKCDSDNASKSGGEVVKCEGENNSNPDLNAALMADGNQIPLGDPVEEVSGRSGTDDVRGEPDNTAEPNNKVVANEDEKISQIPGDCTPLETEAVESGEEPLKSKDGKDGETGIDDEMEAIFGEPSDKSGVLEAQHAPPETNTGSGDDAAENPTSSEGIKPAETPDDSNLEVMMEKLHADKIGSPLSKPKTSESTMELSDVLQALTEDDPSDRKNKDKTKKSASNSKKKLGEAEESEQSSEIRATRSRAKKEVNSDDSSESEADKEGNARRLRNKRLDSSGRGSSSNAKRKVVKKDNVESEGENSESEKADQKKTEIVKRPRGRPRKNPLPETAEQKEKVEKHKVGKNVDMHDESSDDESSKSLEKAIAPKRGRGRPKRQSLEDDDREAKDKKPKVGTVKKTGGEDTGEDSSDDEPTVKTPRPGRPSKRPIDDSGSDTPVSKGLRQIKKTKPSDSKSDKVNLISKSNKVCVVADCRQHCLPTLGISLHRFPMANNPMRPHWLALINETLPGPNTAYMCSKHFKETDYTYDETKNPTETFYRKLKPLAFPTVGLPVKDGVIEEVRAKVAVLSAGKDPNELKRSFLKEVSKKIKVDDKGRGAESSSRPGSKAGSRSPSPTLVENTPSKTPATKKKMADYEPKGRTPGTNCSVPCCGNNLFETRAEGLNISYYRFPFDDALAARWIKRIGDPDLIARTARICSDHFLDKDFEGTLGGKRNLKPKAVPSQYLTHRKPRERGRIDDQDSADEESDDDRYVRRKAKSEPRKPKKPKPDTSFITMPLPIIEDVDIKSEPASDNEIVGQEYAPSDPGSGDEESQEKATEKTDKAKVGDGDEDLEDEEPLEVKRGRGRPRKSSLSTSPRKIVTFRGLSLPVINVERLGQRVIDAAESGSLRVRIKESAEASKARAQLPKPVPKSKRKLPESDSDSPPKVMTRPGPLCKKKKLLVNTPVVPKKPRSQKILKMSDYESSESDIDDPDSVQEETGVASTSFAKSPNPIKVKLAELPSFLRDKAGKEGVIPDDATMDITSEELDAIINSDKSEKEKIIQLVEQRISEHTKIIEGKSMGAQELADHNKILQGSALVLKKLAEKSGKPFTPSQVISLNVPDNTSVTSGRTIVLKKVPDPGKLGLKPPRTVSSPTSPVKPPTAIVTPQSSPARALKSDDLPEESKHSASAMEKIRDYDNLMKKYLSAVLDKNVMSKKYTESKEAQKLLENKFAEKVKECENLKRKAASLNAKMNRINTALEYFLTPNQIKLALQETKKVAWSPEEMLTAFTIKHLSKACYLFLRHKLNYPLPGISSLQRWMTMLSKDKAGDDDEDNIADEDLSDKEEGQEILVEGPGVVNEISGTLEEINAGGMPGEDEEYVTEQNVQDTKGSNQSSPFQVVFENEGDSNRKVIILKKMPNSSGKMKSKLQISASKNEVNVSSIEESDSKDELYKLLPGAKTISMATSPSASSQKRKVLLTKTIQEKEKISFQRLPQVRKEIQNPPTIQMVKSEPQEELRQYAGGEQGDAKENIQMALNELGGNETIVKPEDVSHHPDDQQQQEQLDGTEQKYFSISDLNSTQMEEHVVENVEHSSEEGQTVQHPEQQVEEAHEQKEVISGKVGDESGQIHQEHVVHHGASGLEELVQLATSGEQQIAFATTEDLARAGQYAQIAYAQGHQGEITLSEDINNMTAVVINDIDEDQLNTLLMSNVVGEKSDQPGSQFGQKKIVYQTVDNQKNVIVLQPDSQAFIEEDEGTNSGAPRVYIINDEGHIVSSGGREPPGPPRSREISVVGPSGHVQSRPMGFAGPSGPPPQEIGFIDSASFAELGLKLGEPEAFNIGNLIQDYAIDSPTKPRK